MLNNQSKLPPILDAGNYTEYKEYSLENSVFNNTMNYNKILPADTPIIFDIQYTSIPSCTNFIICNGTDARPNRVATIKPLVKPYSMMPSLSKYDPIRKKSDITKLYYCNCVN
jgi:hypothetical protein